MPDLQTKPTYGHSFAARDAARLFGEFAHRPAQCFARILSFFVAVAAEDGEQGMVKQRHQEEHHGNQQSRRLWFPKTQFEQQRDGQHQPGKPQQGAKGNQRGRFVWLEGVRQLLVRPDFLAEAEVIDGSKAL